MGISGVLVKCGELELTKIPEDGDILLLLHQDSMWSVQPRLPLSLKEGGGINIPLTCVLQGRSPTAWEQEDVETLHTCG